MISSTFLQRLVKHYLDYIASSSVAYVKILVAFTFTGLFGVQAAFAGPSGLSCLSSEPDMKQCKSFDAIIKQCEKEIADQPDVESIKEMLASARKQYFYDNVTNGGNQDADDAALELSNKSADLGKKAKTGFDGLKVSKLVSAYNTTRNQSYKPAGITNISVLKTAADSFIFKTERNGARFDSELGCHFKTFIKNQKIAYAGPDKQASYASCTSAAKGFLGIDETSTDPRVQEMCGVSAPEAVSEPVCRTSTRVTGFPTWEEYFDGSASGNKKAFGAFLIDIAGAGTETCKKIEGCKPAGKRIATLERLLRDTEQKKAELTAKKTKLEEDKTTCEGSSASAPANPMGGINIVSAVYKPNWKSVPQECKCNAKPDLLLACQSTYVERRLCVKLDPKNGDILNKTRVDADKDGTANDQCDGDYVALQPFPMTTVSLLKHGSRKTSCKIAEVSHRHICGGLNPLPEVRKLLDIVYSCSDDTSESKLGRVRVRDRDTVFLSCFDGKMNSDHQKNYVSWKKRGFDPI